MAEAAFQYEVLPNGWRVGRFRSLSDVDGIVHVVTTCEGLDPQLVATNQAAAAGQLANALNLSAIDGCEQVHGCIIKRAVGGGWHEEADGIVTNEPGVGVLVRSADCPLILAANTVTGAIGAAHASWRGTVGRIASKLVVEMISRYGGEPADILACIAPSAGPCCYEVREDLRAAVLGGVGPHAETFFQRREGRLFFDLWAANAHELVRAGVPECGVEVAGVCTICHDEFPSRRREGEAAGRFVAVIGTQQPGRTT
jgi:hypothetical protein